MNKKYICLLIFLSQTLITGCKDKDIQYTNPAITVKKAPPANNIKIDLTIESMLDHNSLEGLNFILENKDKTISITGLLDCEPTVNNTLIKCSSKLQNNNLSPGFYRLIIKDYHSDGVACDIVEYSKTRPINLILNKNSSGECIYYQLLDDTHLSEAELYNRINYITNRKYINEPINELLYELYKYFNTTSESHQETWDKLINAVKHSERLPQDVQI